MKMGIVAVGLIVAGTAATGQQSGTGSIVSAATSQTNASSDSQAPRVITLEDALQRARKLDPTYRSAITDAGIAHEDHVQARAALLPSVSENTEYLYTEGTGTPTPRYIANNSVRVCEPGQCTRSG